MPLAVFGTGVYGGYFGAAQGVLLMGVLGIGISESLQRLNGVKNVLVAVVNGVAGLVFVGVAELGLFGSEAKVDWLLVLLVGVGAVCGGLLGSAIGRRLSPIVLRAVIVVVGVFGAFTPQVSSALSGAGWQDSGIESVQARELIWKEFAARNKC